MGNGRALIMGETDGMVKIVAERGGAILGVHIAGPWATELIAEAYLSVNWEATPADIGLLIHAHPTLSELFGESALALTGRLSARLVRLSAERLGGAHGRHDAATR